MQMSRDKSVELAQQYSRVHWLEQYNASLVARLGNANTLVSNLGARNHALEEELARAHGDRDAQRAMAEQKAQEVELQTSALQQKDEALEAREAELRLKETAIMTLTDALVQKHVALETQGAALSAL